MGLVQHEGGPCGVLAAIQVMASFFDIAYEPVACCLLLFDFVLASHVLRLEGLMLYSIFSIMNINFCFYI